jgi:hypothetical protein
MICEDRHMVIYLLGRKGQGSHTYRSFSEWNTLGDPDNTNVLTMNRACRLCFPSTMGFCLCPCLVSLVVVDVDGSRMQHATTQLSTANGILTDVRQIFVSRASRTLQYVRLAWCMHDVVVYRSSSTYYPRYY